VGAGAGRPYPLWARGNQGNRNPRLTSTAAICVNHSRHSSPKNAARTGGTMREVIATEQAPQAIGPYSQAIRAQGLIFTSGQIAIDPATAQIIASNVSAQTDRVLKNLSAILQASGSSLEKVLRCTVFLKNMGDFAAMNEVYGRYFQQEPPARSTVEVARLPKDVLIEIDVIALA
jgi:2-iminobutanoate/2-iminopropanoate deaminase